MTAFLAHGVDHLCWKEPDTCLHVRGCASQASSQSCLPRNVFAPGGSAAICISSPGWEPASGPPWEKDVVCPESTRSQGGDSFFGKSRQSAQRQHGRAAGGRPRTLLPHGTGVLLRSGRGRFCRCHLLGLHWFSSFRHGLSARMDRLPVGPREHPRLLSFLLTLGVMC